MKTIQIDNEVLSNLYDDCQDSLNEVFTEFISSYEVMTQDFSSAFNSGNLSSLKRLLHFHGPSYMYLGLPQVADMFRQLEHKCREVGNHFAISADFMQLRNVMDISYQGVANRVNLLKEAV
ncbi:MAG: Hpt domain-containing protein [Bacteroidetes bacterium]|nr:Hpt domain-containing protein [Bacteroidota bacterium]